MQQFEYKVVPAPDKGTKIKGLKTPAERYARAVGDLMNQLSQDGWEYWRADTLPSEERKGLTGSITVFHNLLVFRRPSAEVLAQAAQGRLSAPAPTPVMATALSAGDGWPPAAATRAGILTAGTTTAAIAAPIAPISPHAPEGRTPSLTAQRGWEPEHHDDETPDAPVGEDTAGHEATEDSTPPSDPADPVENLFYGSDDDDAAHDTTADQPDRDDTPPSRS